MRFDGQRFVVENEAELLARTATDLYRALAVLIEETKGGSWQQDEAREAARQALVKARNTG